MTGEQSAVALTDLVATLKEKFLSIRTREAGTLRRSDAGTTVTLPGGWPAVATWAAWRSSTCATRRALRRWYSARARWRKRPSGCVRSFACGSSVRYARGRPATTTPSWRPVRSRSLPPELEVLSEAAPLPFPIAGNAEINEEARLKYRYLDLRREGPATALRVRSQANRVARDVMAKAPVRRGRDAEPDEVDPPKVRARLLGAGATSAWPLVRAPAVTSAFQAVADGGGHGALTSRSPAVFAMKTSVPTGSLSSLNSISR